MILDAYLLLADNASSTVSGASTNVIDQVAGNNFLNSSAQGAYAVVGITSAWTESGTNTVTFQLQASNDEDFLDSTSETLSSSADESIGTLVAGYQIKLPIPPTRKQYLRIYKVVTGNSGANYITAAGYDMFIAKDVNINNDLA